MRLLLAPAFAIGLAGCQSLAAPGGALATICATEPALYLALSLAGQATPTVVIAHRVITGVCLNPPTDIASGLAAALSAYAIIQGARP